MRHADPSLLRVTLLFGWGREERGFTAVLLVVRMAGMAKRVCNLSLVPRITIRRTNFWLSTVGQHELLLL